MEEKVVVEVGWASEMEKRSFFVFLLTLFFDFLFLLPRTELPKKTAHARK